MRTLTHPQPRLETARIGAEIKKTGPATVEPAELALATVNQSLPRLNASFSALRGEIGSHGFANLVAQTGDLRLVEVLGHLKDLMILVPHLFKTALGQSERSSSGFFKAEAAPPGEAPGRPAIRFAGAFRYGATPLFPAGRDAGFQTNHTEIF